MPRKNPPSDEPSPPFEGPARGRRRRELVGIGRLARAMVKDTFPALSIRQPWADLVMWGIKDVENRTWATKFRGRLLVHAGRRVDREAVDCLEEWYGVVLPEEYRPRIGVLLGSVELTACVARHPSPFFHGPCGFVVRRPLELAEPVPCRGRLGIFPVPRGLLRGTAAEAMMLREFPGN